MRVKIVPHGILRETWPEGFEIDAETPQQAIAGFTRQFPVARLPDGQMMTVRVVGYETVQALQSPIDTPVLHVVPDFTVGGGGGGTWKIVAGVVLIAAAVALSMIPGGFAGSATIIGFLASTGVSLVAGGILELMSPSPKTSTPTEGTAQSEGSKYLGSPKNTVKIGTRVQLAFGRVPLYGHFISFDIEARPVDIPGVTPSASARRKVAGLRVGYAT